MKKLFLGFVALISSDAISQVKSAEDIIKSYYGGFESKDWSMVSAVLADDFTFTSPAPDDHINKDQFKAKCWTQAPHIRKFEFIRFFGNETEKVALIHVVTNSGEAIRNLEYFTIEKGKIKSIEVFFGGTGQGYPTNK